MEESIDTKTFTAVGTAQKSKGRNSKYEQTVDIKAAKGNYSYYRLKMVDLDKTVSYSKVVSIQNDCRQKKVVF